ncbi:MAG: CAP domain-containing protein [Cyclobacteriaceae bacterium]|jgi:hypothetical protein|nr:CAP domain-containing protein [Cyclobacteriaceae bacterium]
MTRVLWVGLALFGAVAASAQELNTAHQANYLTEAEKEVIRLVNEVRAQPAAFAKKYLESRQGEGAYAKECYDELLRWAPQSVLQPSHALSLAAKDHARDMGTSGKTGHVSTQGENATQRVQRYGTFTGRYNGPWENCSYGFDDPLAIVLQLLIDDGVPSRGHRKNIMQADIRYIGVSIQPHTNYRFNCVMDMADAVADKN